MKEIMISIKPEYVEKILNNTKTIEIRKTKPSCELPCKVYIYCSNGNMLYDLSNCGVDELEQRVKVKQTNRFLLSDILKSNNTTSCSVTFANKKVIADFTLNRIDTLERDLNDWLPKNRYDISNELLKGMKLNQEQLWEYGQGKTLYAWHIDNLKIYDEPKDLSEFTHYIPNNKCPKKECGIDCEDCMSYDSEHETCLALYYSHRQIKTPPKNYCYVESSYVEN